MTSINQSRVLIIGGTGSWGQMVAHLLLEESLCPKEVIIYSRAERTQFEMKENFNNEKLRFEIGDVRDKERLMEVMEGVDIVFHLAALKHVPVCETNPLEAIKTNVIGLQNSIDAAIFHKVSKFIYLSTDKAVEPINAYGMTKSLGEKMVEAAPRHNGTKFMIMRAGNVVGSNGSIVPKMVKQAKETGVVTVTDYRMVRYMIGLEFAARFLITSSQYIGLWVLPMKAFKIKDVAEMIARKYDAEVKEIGIRPGEKLFEKLFLGEDDTPISMGTEQELFELINPFLI